MHHNNTFTFFWPKSLVSWGAQLGRPPELDQTLEWPLADVAPGWTQCLPLGVPVPFLQPDSLKGLYRYSGSSCAGLLNVLSSIFIYKVIVTK